MRSVKYIIATAKGAIETLKAVKDLFSSGKDNSAARQKLEELGNQLYDLREKINESREENLLLKQECPRLGEENQKLQEEAKVKGDLVFDGYAYHTQVDIDVWDGVFCPTCWDDSKKLVRMILKGVGKYDYQDFESYYYLCALHKQNIFIPKTDARELVYSRH